MAIAIDRRAFQFSKLLASVSDGLGREDVRGIKNLCYDNIPARKREEIDNGLDIFQVLREKKVIAADNPAFLKELLTEIGRVDLAEKVDEYVQKVLDVGLVEPQKVTECLERGQLMRIATDVGRDWRMLSRYLGLDDTTITSIQLQSQGDLAEASLQSLLRWQKNSGPEKATPRALKAALTEMKLLGIVHTHFQ
ncbi:FAS-associated death domain protein-like [Halichondria panicea]|uniref:FAS-associated death domain protein-like n=1 Tax=Halichondria panicea TaxID=6063 RepID=UPI00312B76F2